jgi:hypothetical protein
MTDENALVAARGEIVAHYAELLRITRRLGAMGQEIETLTASVNAATDVLAAHAGIDPDEALAALYRKGPKSQKTQRPQRP